MNSRCERMLVVALLVLGSCTISAPASSQSSIPVYIERKISAEEHLAVNDLCYYLGKASGKRYLIDSTSKFTGSGIYLTTVARDSYGKAPSSLKGLGPEGVYIKGSARSVYIVGAGPLGLQQGIYLYLDKLGFRFYFPNPAWHIIPVQANVLIPIDLLAKPSLAHRSLSMGWGFGDEKLKEQFLTWQRLNLMPGDMQLNIAHSYYGLLNDYTSIFEKNPQFLTKPLLNGKKQLNAVLNYSDPDLPEVVYQWAAAAFDKAQQSGQRLDMKSLEPFDGGNFCDLPACKKIGATVSDQVFYFTNLVARKLKKSHPGKLIGMLAYYDHNDIPKYPVEDNIFVTLANGYNSTYYSTDQLIERWKTKVKRLGIYDYMAVYAGSSAELPGKDVGGKYLQVAASLKKFIDEGITAYQAESTNGWIAKGLSHYLIAKIAWDKNVNVNDVLDDFFRQCFKQSGKPIRKIYESWNNKYTVTDDDFRTWFTNLREAFSTCTDPAELERINQLALYLYYVKLHQEYSFSKGSAATQKGLELCAFMNDVMTTGVVPSFAALNTLPQQMGTQYAIGNKTAAWKTMKVNYPHTKQDWLSFIDTYLPGLRVLEGVKKYSLQPFLTPAELKKVPAGFTWITPKRTMSFSGTLTAIIDTRGVPLDSLFVRMNGGTYRKSGRIGMRVYAWNDALTPSGKLLKQVYFPGDGNNYILKLADLPRNRYILSFTDDGTLGVLYFPEKMKFSFIASADNPIPGGSFNSFYFYVPEGTNKFYINKTAYLQIYSPTNKQTISPIEERVMEIKVTEPGWWKAHLQREQFYLTGIPPLISRDPASFLFP